MDRSLKMSEGTTAKGLWDIITGGDSDTIKIHLPGVARSPMTLHRKILTHHSPYFRELLAQNGTGDQTFDSLECLEESLHLSSSKPFELFAQFLYTGKIDEVPGRASVEAPRYNLFDYIRVWILCDHSHFQIPTLQGLALERIREYYRERSVKLNSQQVKYIYNNCARGCELRKLVAEEAIHEFMKDASIEPSRHNVLCENSYEYFQDSVEFASDMLYAAKRGVTKGWPHPFKSQDASELTPPHSLLNKGAQDVFESPPGLGHDSSPLAIPGVSLDPTTPTPNPRFGDPVLISSQHSHSALQFIMQQDAPTTTPKKLFGEMNDDGSVVGISTIIDQDIVVVQKAITI